MPDLYRRVDACRSCGSQHLQTVLDLGQPYISDFLKAGESGTRAPLHMVRCEDCTLVQTRHTVDRERLFRDAYWYRSATNESMVAALDDVVFDALAHISPIVPGLHFLDIGSNDGTLLKQYARHMPTNYYTAAGFEPASTFDGADYLRLGAFFPDHASEILGDNYFHVITSIAMFYAQDDPNAFVAAIKRILHPEGVWVVQLQDLNSVLRDRAFDYFCHEHLCLYSPVSFDRLLARHGLEIQDISRNSVNGGSIRFIVGHGTKRLRDIPEPENWADFARAVNAQRDETLALLASLRRMGKVVLGYGASTKGNTLLQYYGIGPEVLPAIAERQEAKWGLRTVTDIPIISEVEMRSMRPDYLLSIPWHFIDSFQKRESIPFIVPLPHLEIRIHEPVAA